MVIHIIHRIYTHGSQYKSWTCAAIGLSMRVSTKYQNYVCYIYVTWIWGQKYWVDASTLSKRVCGRRPPPSPPDYIPAYNVQEYEKAFTSCGQPN